MNPLKRKTRKTRDEELAETRADNHVLTAFERLYGWRFRFQRPEHTDFLEVTAQDVDGKDVWFATGLYATRELGWPSENVERLQEKVAEYLLSGFTATSNEVGVWKIVSPEMTDDELNMKVKLIGA